MYAVRRTYVKQWDCQPPEERYEVHVTRGGKPVTDISPERISYVEEDVMQWRKANHIHHWFVENVQDGNDNGGDYCVPSEQLAELLVLCEKVIEASELVDGEVSNGEVYDFESETWQAKAVPGKVIKDPSVAKELLPTIEGFFFGSQDYDESYLEDVVETRDWIVQTLAEEVESETSSCIHYSSSW
jgi:hypothetical protein